MRVLFWYIKSHLEHAYLMSSTKTTEFLPHIEIPSLEGQPTKLKDVIIPRMDQLKNIKALPQIEKVPQEARR